MALIHQAHGCDREKGVELQPQDIAHMLLFLLDERSRGVSGAVIPVDNAWSTI
jgi:NAD(P)-dependent dehydrogenase (short-subunit alcohol dehydrogenase family)